MNSYEKVKRELYPKIDTEKWEYGKQKKDNLVPYNDHANKIKTLIKDLVGKDKSDAEINELIRASYVEKHEEKYLLKYNWTQNYKMKIIKGSIYKIKKYFLESNYIKQIRGGSAIIDYLNTDGVNHVLRKNGFTKDNIVYCGGGNIFLAIPIKNDNENDIGIELCKEFEEYFTQVSLTAMNAFESITCTLYDFMFSFSKISKKVNNKLEERKKIKLYDVNKDSDISDIAIFNGKQNGYKKINKKGTVCSFCDLRDAKYSVKFENEVVSLCPSCFRKHIVGKEAKVNYFEGFKTLTGKDYTKIDSIDDLDDDKEIAVIYGDGNNMGQIVMNVSNVFEMMYFSKKTDESSKKAVYESISEINTKYKIDKAKFEVIALGGDDIFIILPAKHCLEVCSKIINKFDNSFSNKITMSIGVVISKSNTPIASTFELAQKRLKKAKELVKQRELKEGSIDVIELTGEMHDISKKARNDKNSENQETNNKDIAKGKIEFPISNSMFKEVIKVIENAKYKKKASLNSQLNKFSYASKEMVKEEFELFYLYQKSKARGYSVDKMIDEIYKSENSNEFLNPYEINWDDILLMWNRV